MCFSNTTSVNGFVYYAKWFINNVSLSLLYNPQKSLSAFFIQTIKLVESSDPVHPQIRNADFSFFACSTIIHLDCFGVSCRVLRDTGLKIVCLLSNKIELDDTRLMVFKKDILKSATALSLSRNHDPVTQDKPLSLLWAVSWRICFFSTKPCKITAQWSVHLLMDERPADY